MQAVALKKYRCGTSPVSKTSDNEHTAASLGHSEVLSVKHAERDAVGIGDPRDEARVCPATFWDFDFLARDEAQKACKVLSSVA